ncbi:hypothetical protein HPB48_020366 [Haemaphysalis longicornis]|uniref:Uncharacterized protein n=1 Tax=Haemaphysalis longicornis TaxID=44386 RepID=A0A9J6GYT1_HAELO|nr:hypothetical protein HPB48_020366 [Haemaphysalis longicornis]
MERRRRALTILLALLAESAYTDELIRDLGDSPVLRLSESQAEFLRQRLARLYEHVRRHPALHQRYLWVGRDKPPVNPDEPPVHYQAESLQSTVGYEPAASSVGPSKRAGEGASRVQRDSRSPREGGGAGAVPPRVPQGERGSVRGVKRTPPHTPLAPLSEEICRTSTAWERINQTVDSFGNAVEVVQDEAFPQWVFSYRCASQGSRCVGIDSLYDSECTERSGFMILYHRKSGAEGDNQPSWGAVEVPHHCTCKITPKVIAEA